MSVVETRNFQIHCDGCNDPIIQVDSTRTLTGEDLDLCGFYCPKCLDKVSIKRELVGQSISVSHGAPVDNSQVPHSPVERKLEETRPTGQESAVEPKQTGDTLEVEDPTTDEGKDHPRVTQGLGGKLAEIKESKEQETKA